MVSSKGSTKTGSAKKGSTKTGSAKKGSAKTGAATKGSTKGGTGSGSGGTAAATQGVKKTVRKLSNSVFLNVSADEFLLYKVTVQGATPQFAVVDSSDRIIMSSKDAPNPPGSGTFQREWPKPIDPTTTLSTHTLAVHFVAALKYTYVVEHRALSDGGSTLIEVLNDIDFESNNAKDFDFQALNVTVV
ncbi:MAG TPA: hypothetical protein VGX48_03650 [Pyrinomonadaceae bacterium]|jgi:hypothetical protein|nr:hypothetical protein [Pyrinomonadaceae bacterium]